MEGVQEYLEALTIGISIAKVLLNIQKYDKAIGLFKECLVLLNSDTMQVLLDLRKQLILIVYGKLGTACYFSNDFTSAIDYYNKALTLAKEMKNKEGECKHYGNLGSSYLKAGEYEKAIECSTKALRISQATVDKREESINNGNLGSIYQCLGDYPRSLEYHKRSLEINKELRDFRGEAHDYDIIGDVHRSLGDLEKAIEFYEKATLLKGRIGDRRGECNSADKLAAVCLSTGKFKEAHPYQLRALEISRENGDRVEQRRHESNLGVLYDFLGEYTKARECYENALQISREIGDAKLEALSLGNLGAAFGRLGEFLKAIECLTKALEIRKRIGDKEGEATHLGNPGATYHSIDQNAKAAEHYDKYGESDCYQNLGSVYESVGDYTLAIENYEKALHITEETGDKNGQGNACAKIGLCLAWNGDISKALHYLSASIDRYESVRRLLGDKDHFKVSFSDRNIFPYKLLVCLLCQSKESVNKALYTAELGRARGLADLMSKQYFVQEGGQGEELRISDIETLPLKNDCTLLFLSYHVHELFIWVVKPDRCITSRKVSRNTLEEITQRIKGMNIEALFESMVDMAYAQYKFGRGIDCEDRSLLMFQVGQTDAHKDIPPTRLFEEDDNDDGDEEVLLDSASETAMRMWYKMIVAPVEDLLDGSELIVVPEGLLYRLPLAALEDSNGKHLSETYKLRVIPSLTTLKLIQASPTDYHSETGALIVGDPDVGRVRLRGTEEYVSRLSSAKEEAEMIGKLLKIGSSRVLTGRQATKEAVLQEINSVSLIHIAAHGDAERGEICLSPICNGSKVPEKEDFMLTMSDVSNVQLRAKLVVLSCCHSGRGQIKAEGVVGIARAFLGSGARSVLVTLWAIEDKATMQFMKQFYERLVRGESASESLNNTMKWMRGSNWYSKVSQWAPFVLVGDDVTLNFVNGNFQ